MPSRRRPAPIGRGHLTRGAWVIAALLAAWSGSSQAEQTQPPPRTSTTAANQKAALKAFEERLEAYLDLRKTLSRKLQPMETTSDATELAGRQKALAAAIAHARREARPGDLIPAEIAAQIKEAVAADLKTREPAARRAALDEVPVVPLRLNQPFPADAALTTIPPLLLARLPALPDNLQYRFVGRHMALLDGDVHIVLDYVDRVLPPQQAR